MVTFIRGNSTFYGPGQVYVKILPDGESVQLTHDSLEKMSAAFSPDGARIAYTVQIEQDFSWDTWAVSVFGGEPQLWLKNASGLVWTAPGRLLFSEIKTGLHMGIVAAEESRMGARNVYLPTDTMSMAHRSYLSPDGKWVLLVEMDQDHLWLPCRVTPADGSSQVTPWVRRAVAPPAPGRPTASGSISLPLRPEATTSGGNVFPAVCRSRSHRGRPRRKA